MAITLKAARVNAGLTQSEAALKIGVSLAALGKWERYKSVPNSKYIPAIEHAYKIEYKDIIFLHQNNA